MGKSASSGSHNDDGQARRRDSFCDTSRLCGEGHKWPGPRSRPSAPCRTSATPCILWKKGWTRAGRWTLGKLRPKHPAAQESQGSPPPYPPPAPGAVVQGAVAGGGAGGEEAAGDAAGAAEGRRPLRALTGRLPLLLQPPALQLRRREKQGAGPPRSTPFNRVQLKCSFV